MREQVGGLHWRTLSTLVLTLGANLTAAATLRGDCAVWLWYYDRYRRQIYANLVEFSSSCSQIGKSHHTECYCPH